MPNTCSEKLTEKQVHRPHTLYLLLNPTVRNITLLEKLIQYILKRLPVHFFYRNQANLMLEFSNVKRIDMKTVKNKQIKKLTRIHEFIQ